MPRLGHDDVLLREADQRQSETTSAGPLEQHGILRNDDSTVKSFQSVDAH
jgi:hypothetical protein